MKLKKPYVYPFGVALLALFLLTACSRQESIETLNKKAQTFYHEKQFEKAIQTAEKSLLKTKKKYGEKCPMAGNILQDLGTFYYAAGNIGKAVDSYVKALEIVRKNNGSDSLDASKIINNIAGIFASQKMFSRAAEYYGKSLDIAKKCMAPGDSRLKMIESNLKTCRDNINTQPKGISLSSKMPAVPDLVPDEIKKFAIDNFAKMEITISGLHPEPLIPVKGKGVVFPYRCIQKDENKTKQIMIMFAAIQDKNEKNKFIFKETRMVSYQSFLSDLQRGGTKLLQQEVIRLFPKVYATEITP